MLKDLIASQKKAFSANLAPNDSVEPLLGNLRRKGEISTAVVLLEGEGRASILFIFQNTLYAAYNIQGNDFKTISLFDYFQEMSRAYGTLHLYLISPVLFKTLLVMAQTQATAVVSSDMIDNARLLANIDRDKKEAVVALKNENRLNLFYFRGGSLCDAYIESAAVDVKGLGLRGTFLAFTDVNQNPPIDIALYEQIAIAPASDQEEAAEHIASITPSDYELWTQPETPSADTETAVQTGRWALEFLNGDRAGTTVDVAKKRATIGRGLGDIRLNDAQVSRHHADMEQTGNDLIISDQKSTNGLFVNDEKVTRKKLSPKDIIRLGDTRLKVVRRS